LFFNAVSDCTFYARAANSELARGHLTVFFFGNPVSFDRLPLSGCEFATERRSSGRRISSATAQPAAGSRGWRSSAAATERRSSGRRISTATAQLGGGRLATGRRIGAATERRSSGRRISTATAQPAAGFSRLAQLGRGDGSAKLGTAHQHDDGAAGGGRLATGRRIGAATDRRSSGRRISTTTAQPAAGVSRRDAGSARRRIGEARAGASARRRRSRRRALQAEGAQPRNAAK
jgi:hypothetical protein